MTDVADAYDVQFHWHGAGSVYFITDDVAIKIGFAKDVEKRLQELQVAHHVVLRLLCSIACSRQLEQAIHARLEHLRIRGEWFMAHDDLFDVLVEIEDNPGYKEGDSDAD